MTERKRYTISTENLKTTGDFSEEEIERIRKQFHGHISIQEVKDVNWTLDFDAIAKELARA